MKKDNEKIEQVPSQDYEESRNTTYCINRRFGSMIFEETVFEVAAVNPMASMQAVENKKLNKVAEEITDKLEKIIKNL